MLTKIGTRGVIIGLVATAIVGSIGYNTLLKPKGDGSVRVVFRTEWMPQTQAAALVTYGPSDPARTEFSRNVKPAFERTRLLRRGDIAEIDVHMPGGAQVEGWTCRIIVGREAAKISRGQASRCHVAKYVP